MKISLVSLAIIAMFASAGCAAQSADEASTESPATQDLEGTDPIPGVSKRPSEDHALEAEAARCETGSIQEKTDCVANARKTGRLASGSNTHPSEHPLVEQVKEVEDAKWRVRE
jgi:hypothetical protein